MQALSTSRPKDRRALLIAGLVFLVLAPVVLFLGIAVKFELSLALILDSGVLTACLVLLWRHGRLSAMHPATTYLFFHTYTVTLRLAALALGAQTLPAFKGAITLQEITRASAVADVALLFMSLAWIRVARKDLERNGPMPGPDTVQPSDLDHRYFWYVAIPTFLIGLFGLSNFGYAAEAPNVDFGAWTTSNYLRTTTTWSYLAILLLIYIYGFRPWLFYPALFFLAVMSINADRFVVVVSTVFMCFVYLSRQRKKWFPPWMLAILFAVAVIWVPLKVIARDIRARENMQTVVVNAFGYYEEAVSEQSGGGDTQFLDMSASVMTLVDEYGEFFYGRAWLPIVTVAIPRQLWVDKPAISDYLWKISTPDRPMAQIGMVPLLFGDAYVNFGYVGVAVVPFVIATIYGWAYFKAFRRSHYSLARFTYLVFAANLIQVFRDGVMSIVLFSFITMMPMMAVVFLHLVFKPHASKAQKQPPSVAATGLPKATYQEPPVSQADPSVAATGKRTGNNQW